MFRHCICQRRRMFGHSLYLQYALIRRIRIHIPRPLLDGVIYVGFVGEYIVSNVLVIISVYS